MMNLSLNEFAHKLENELMFYMPKQIQMNCTLQLKKISENYSLQLSDHTVRLHEMPVLDINRLYEELKNTDIDYDKTMLEIAQGYVKEFEVTKQLDTEKTKTLNDVMVNYPKDKIIFAAIKNYEDSKIMNENPHVRKGDLVLLFSVYMSNSNDELKTCTVTYEMMKGWGVTEKDLFLDAKRNTPVHFPYTFEELDNIYYSNIYIVSNIQKSFGLSTIFYDAGPLGEIAKELNDNLYVFPLSVNEFVVFPENGDFTEEDLKEMTKNNKVLMNEVLYYNKSTDLLALNKLEKLEQEVKSKKSVLDPAEKNLRGNKSRL